MTGAHESRTDDGTVPILKGSDFYKDFCQKYQPGDEIQQLLENEKFETSEALLEAAESNLEKAGFTQDRIAEVTKALTEFFKDGGQNPDQRVTIDGQMPILNTAEFCKKYQLNDEIQQLLKNEKFETAEALLNADESNLEKAGFKQDQIVDLKSALPVTEFTKDGGQS